jgi:hypothetical protein
MRLFPFNDETITSISDAPMRMMMISMKKSTLSWIRKEDKIWKGSS